MAQGSCSLIEGVVIGIAAVGVSGVRGDEGVGGEGVWRALSDVCCLCLGAGFGLLRSLFQNRFLEGEELCSVDGLVAMADTEGKV